MDFNPICGENVVLEENRTVARWKHTLYGGIFGAYPLRQGEQYQLQIQGRGYIELGFIQTQTRELRQPARDVHRLKKMKEMSLTEENTNITFFLVADGSSVEIRTRQDTYRHTTDKNQFIWLALNATFGKLTVSFCEGADGRVHNFSRRSGKNIEFNSDQTIAKTKDSTPDSICYSSRAMFPGNTLLLTCTSQSTTQGNTSPYRRLTFFVSTEDPTTRLNRFGTTAEPFWVELKSLEHNECDGFIRLSVSHGCVSLTLSDGKSFNLPASPNDSKRPLWVGLRLFMVRVCIKRDKEARDLDNIRRRLSGDILQAEECTPRRHSNEVRVKNAILSEPRRATGPVSRTCDVDQNVPLKSEIKHLSREISIVRKEVGNQGKRVDADRRRLSDARSQADKDRQCLKDLCFEVERLTTRMDTLEQKLCEQASNSCSLVNDQNVSTSQHSERVDLSKQIRKSYVFLVENMKSNVLLDYLYQDEIISDMEADDVRKLARDDSKQANRNLLKILSRKPIRPTSLLHSLQETGQDFLADVLLQKQNSNMCKQ